jgi:hypothetical protein
MINYVKRIYLVPLMTGLLVAPATSVYAQDKSHEEHHPAAAATTDTNAAKPETPPPASEKPADATTPGGMKGGGMPGGGMMGGDHMPQMMKMMQEMHGKMMGGGMSMQPKGDTGPSSLAFSGIMTKMHNDMAITYTGNADVDFVKAMIPHHQSAVDMAKTVLAFGKDSEIKKLAKDVIEAQEKEIKEMKDWLKKQGQ